MRIFNRACDLLCTVLLAVSEMLLVVLLCSSSLQVFSRYFMENTVTWTEECSRYCFIWLDMLGAAVLVYKGGHAVVDIIVSRFHGTAAKIYNTCIYIAIGYVAGILTRFGMQLSQATIKQTSSSLHLPMGIIYGVVPLSGLLIGIFVVNRVLGLWLDKSKEEKGDIQG